MELSVIVCTHNPRVEYLVRVLTALRAQSLPISSWELVVIDNASTESIADRFDVSWHPMGRVIREEELGLTPARLRGIAEACGKLLVFVDDDNVLSIDYLTNAAKIGDRHPFLGSWGAGLITPDFEVPPPRWAHPYLAHLAIRDVEQARWSNDVHDWPATPVGAGLCVRAAVANRYRQELLDDGLRLRFDRRGESLDGAGDLDLAYTARRYGLGWGTFPDLQLVHLIPRSRTTMSYLLRITEASSASLVLLAQRVGRDMPEKQGFLKRLIRGLWITVRWGGNSGSIFPSSATRYPKWLPAP